MNIVKDLAPIMAQAIIKDAIKNINPEEVMYFVTKEAPGLDVYLQDNLMDEVERLIGIAQVSVHFPMSDEEIEAMQMY